MPRLPRRHKISRPHRFSSQPFELERRLQLAADVASTATTCTENIASLRSDTISREAQATTSGVIVFIDSSLDDLDGFAGSISPDATVVLLAPGEAPLVQITSVLQKHQQVREIHVISHGSSGRLQLAGQSVDLATIESQQTLLAQWNEHLSENADILLYGCDVAANNQGQRLVKRISQLSGADVAASRDITGSHEKTGNWVLEEVVGSVEAGLVVANRFQTTFAGTLHSQDNLGAGTGNELDEWKRRQGMLESTQAATHSQQNAACTSDTPSLVTVFDYKHFADTSELTLNGSAASNGCGLELTPQSGGLGSAFSSQAVRVNQDTSFRTHFQFQIDGGECSAGADGFVFMLQNNEAGLNAISKLNGESLGYAGITKSLAIEFDTFHNMGDINNNHVSVFVNGDMTKPLVTRAVDFDLNDGAVTNAWIEYDGQLNQLSLYVSRSPERPSTALVQIELELESIVGDRAFAGFSASTGSHFNRHQILGWKLETTQAAIVEDADVILEWTSVMANANAADHSRSAPEQGGPVMTARAFAMITGAMYDAYNSIHPIGTQFEFTVSPSHSANADAAVAQAAHDMLVALYPSQKHTFANELAKTLGRIENGSAEAEGRRVGAEIAALTMQARSGDDKNSLNDPSYVPRGAIGFHDVDPLNPRQGFYGTGAAQIQPFVIMDLADFSVPRLDDGTEIGRLALLNSDAYTEAYNEVKALGGTGADTERTDEQTQIGIYWGYDGRPGIGTPPRLYNQIVREVAIQQGNTEAENARLFALVNIAQADAGLATWDAKYINDLWRPVLGIRNGDADGNIATIGDENWRPLGAAASNPRPGEIDFTPNFPAYTSGHATFGAAVFETLENFYGTDEICFSFISDEYDGKTLDADGTVRPLISRSFDGFTEAKIENAISRIYLGVHWRFDATEGIDVGDRVADYIFANALLPTDTSSHLS